jgi:DNA-binding transcriptional LysR family regulator
MEKDAIIDTEQLRAFEAVANTGSFTRAAAVLGAAQSSISQQVGRLEKRAGRRLINRTTRRVELTPAGRDMLVYVRSILAMAADARSASIFRRRKARCGSASLMSLRQQSSRACWLSFESSILDSRCAF